MSRNSFRLLMLVGCLPLLAPLAGCFFVTDLVNPGVLSAVGFDPATIIPPQGRAVIAFQNSTQYPADFFAVVSDNIFDENADFSVLSAIGVGAAQTRTMAVDCPVGDVVPASVFVTTDTNIVELAYAGAPLRFGSEFVCGDVIEVRVVQVGTDADAEAFGLEVQVLAGR